MGEAAGTSSADLSRFDILSKGLARNGGQLCAAFSQFRAT